MKLLDLDRLHHPRTTSIYRNALSSNGKSPYETVTTAFIPSCIGIRAASILPREYSESGFPNMTEVLNSLYPDLASHQDVVTAAMMSLTAEGFQAQTLSTVIEATATRARTNLQRSKRNSVPLSATDAAVFKQRENAAREEAQRLFPELTTPGSALYQRVTQERAKLGRIYPDYFKNPDWPLMLTNGCIASMTLESQEKKLSNRPKLPNLKCPSIKRSKLLNCIKCCKTLRTLVHDQDDDTAWHFSPSFPSYTWER